MLRIIIISGLISVNYP